MQSAAMTPYAGVRTPRRTIVRAAPPMLIEPERPGESGIDINGLIDILRRRWLTVLLPAAVLTTLAFAYVSLTPKLYQASTLVLLDPRDQKLLANEVLSAGSGSDVALVESQVRIATSDGVLSRVVEKLGLASLPEFGGNASQPADRAANALDRLAGRVTASHADRTYVLELKAASRDPALARDIADAVATAYMADQVDAEKAVTHRANEALTARLAELRDQLRQADEKIRDYRASHGLVGKDGSDVTQQQLAELNQRLVAARADLATKQARYDQVGRSDAASTPESLSSTVISGLRTQLAEVIRREAELSATLGDRHPSVVQIRAQRASLEAQIAQEVNRISSSARGELDIAKTNVAQLQSELDRLTGRDMTDAAALINLRELQRESDATRELYEAMLNRAKQTGEEEQLATTSSRILAPAAVPDVAYFPPKLLFLMMALSVGLGLGIAWALMRERFDDHIRDAVQLRRAGFDVLAVIPPYGGPKRRGAGGFDYGIRLLRAELRDPPERAEQRIALVVSPNAGDGAPAVGLNLALAAVASGERVLIIDADAEYRALSNLVAPDAKFGLAEVLSGDMRLSDALVGSGANGFQALPMAKRQTAYRGRPSRAAFERLIREAVSSFDYIVFVGSPLLDEPDARAIAEAADQIALVLKAQSTTRRDIGAALRALKVRGDKTCGVVLMASAGSAA